MGRGPGNHLQSKNISIADWKCKCCLENFRHAQPTSLAMTSSKHFQARDGWLPNPNPPCQPILALCWLGQSLAEREEKKGKEGGSKFAPSYCAPCQGWCHCGCSWCHPGSLMWSEDLHLHCGPSPPAPGLYGEPLSMVRGRRDRAQSAPFKSPVMCSVSKNKWPYSIFIHTFTSSLPEMERRDPYILLMGGNTGNSFTSGY